MSKFCPHISDECLEDKCIHWQAFDMAKRGQPNNAPGVTMHDCAFNWQAIFLYDALFKLNGTQHAVESFRNETVNQGEGLVSVMAQALHERRQERLEHATREN